MITYKSHVIDLIFNIERILSTYLYLSLYCRVINQPNATIEMGGKTILMCRNDNNLSEQNKSRRWWRWWWCWRWKILLPGWWRMENVRVSVKRKLVAGSGGHRWSEVSVPILRPTINWSHYTALAPGGVGMQGWKDFPKLGKSWWYLKYISSASWVSWRWTRLADVERWAGC